MHHLVSLFYDYRYIHVHQYTYKLSGFVLSCIFFTIDLLFFSESLSNTNVELRKKDANFLISNKIEAIICICACVFQ